MVIRALALDFDGVVWDTQREGYYLSCLVWQKLWGISPACSLETFLSGRWLARSGEEFSLIVLLGELYSDLSNFSLVDFDYLSRRLDKFVKLFGRTLANLRLQMHGDNLKQWLAWQNIFPGVREFLAKNSLPVGICTTKDRASVDALLGTEGIKLPIWSKEDSFDKCRQLELFSQHWQVELGQILFVDDLLDNLLHVQNTGVKLALAGWGYNRLDSRQQALKLGIPVLYSWDDLQTELSQTINAL
ncbi:HAD family hydrolase [bacterium]|nr:HAD family hydrolase [bacterium]